MYVCVCMCVSEGVSEGGRKGERVCVCVRRWMHNSHALPPSRPHARTTPLPFASEGEREGERGSTATLCTCEVVMDRH